MHIFPYFHINIHIFTYAYILDPFFDLSLIDKYLAPTRPTFLPHLEHVKSLMNPSLLLPMHFSLSSSQLSMDELCNAASAATDALCNVASAASDMNSAHNIDWGECMICQKSIKDERTYCPLKGPQAGVREASVVYEAFAGRFQDMRRLGSIPVKEHFKLHNLFEQDTLPNIAHEMFLKQGVWHRPCYNQFNSTAVSRMLQRKRVLDPAGTLPDSASLTNLEPTDMVGPTALNDDGIRRKSFRGASGMFDDNKCIFCFCMQHMRLKLRSREEAL
jgi:hypothetical protein